MQLNTSFWFQIDFGMANGMQFIIKAHHTFISLLSVMLLEK